MKPGSTEEIERHTGEKIKVRIKKIIKLRNGSVVIVGEILA